MSAGLLAALLTEAATKWSRTGTDTNGQPTWSTPVAATCSRWSTVNETVLGANNERRQATAKALVSSGVVQGDKLALGTSVASTPTSSALEVLRVESATTPLDGETVYVALMGG